MVKYLAVLTAFFFSLNSYADSIPATKTYLSTARCSVNGASTKYDFTYSACLSRAISYSNTGSAYIWEESASNGVIYISSVSGSWAYLASWYGLNGGSEYECTNDLYPNLVGELCESAPFEIDSDLIDAYQEYVSNASGLAVVGDSNQSNDFGNLELIENNGDLVLASTAEISSIYDEILNIDSQVTAIDAVDTDNLTSIDNAVTALDEIVIDSSNALDDAFQLAVDASDVFIDSSSLLDENANLSSLASEGLDDLTDYLTGMQSATDEENYNLYKAQFDEQNETITQNNDDYQSNSDSIASNVTTSNDLADSTNTILEGISDLLDSANSEGTTASNASGNGEVCVGSNCVAVPDYEEEEETSDYTLPTDNDAGFSSIITSETKSNLQAQIDAKETELNALIDDAKNLLNLGSLSVADSGYVEDIHEMYGASVDLGAKHLENFTTNFGLKEVVWFIVVLVGGSIVLGVKL